MVQDKDEWRNQARQRRDMVPGDTRTAWSMAIQRKVRVSRWYVEADVVFSYAAFRSEVDTGQINEWVLQDGKVLCLPRVCGARREIEFYQVGDLSSLTAGYWGIREPQEGGRWDFDQVSWQAGACVLMLMPGLAFDRNRNRIGYGGGYYDRYLARWGDRIAYKAMLAFDMQRVPDIVAGQYDIRPDEVVTDGRHTETQCTSGHKMDVCSKSQ